MAKVQNGGTPKVSTPSQLCPPKMKLCLRAWLRCCYMCDL